MKPFIIFLFFPLILLSACIGEDVIFDFVGASVRVSNPLDSLAVGDSHTFEAAYFNEVGNEEPADFHWNSSTSEILLFAAEGVATGIAPGTALVTVTAFQNGQPVARDSFPVVVGENTVMSGGTSRTGTIRSTSSYLLKGSFVLSEQGQNLVLEIGNDYEASTALPGLYLYLTNNPATNVGALEIGAVKVFKGAHSYTIPEPAQLSTYKYVLYYCKPFSVKVGDGEIK
ncbi:MAG: DM13 domain-containing protein [Bacteroidia bacterium]|nr:DM13 domain-containing protein [Bacteroidia bacterium]